MLFDILLFLKRQILELSLPFLEDKIASPSLSQTTFTKKHSRNDYFTPLIYSHSSLLGAFLSVLANLEVSNKFVERLINNCFIRCDKFSDLLKLYGRHLFKVQNYDLILKLLDYYRHLTDIFNPNEG